MQYKLILIGALLVIVIVLAVNLFVVQPLSKTPVTSFEECVAAGNPVQESFPRQCTSAEGTTFTEAVAEPESEQTTIEPTLTQATALAQARASQACTQVGAIGPFESYNPNSGTWWFRLAAQKAGCNPACVVTDATKQAEVNWRCTGLVEQ